MKTAFPTPCVEDLGGPKGPCINLRFTYLLTYMY